MNFTSNQKYALEMMEYGKNIFLTGQAGTGKSLLIKTFYKQSLRRGRYIALTSTTGISALLIGGNTLHSYLGIGLGNGDVDYLVSKVKKSRGKSRWKKMDILIIDEVSMLSVELFDKLECIARVMRKNDNFFGGIQLVMTGDFLQLPCIGTDMYCFESERWKEGIDETIYLTEIQRQRDNDFQECLNQVRVGNITPKVKELLLSRVNVNIQNDKGIVPTKIYSLNADVNAVNTRELEKLTGQMYEYDMDVEIIKKGYGKAFLEEKLKKNCIAEETLRLAEGAQVMLIFNIDVENGLVNGSRGVIVDFMEDMPVVKFLNGKVKMIEYNTWEYYEDQELLGTMSQIPLKLAYGVTTHKVQGSTIDCAEIDLEHIFEYGQAYVALSRVRNLESMTITGIRWKQIKAHPKALEYYRELERSREGKNDIDENKSECDNDIQ